MKKLIIAMMLMAATSQAQTVTINGHAVNQSDTVKCGSLAHVEVANIPYAISMTRTYYGVKYPFWMIGDFMPLVGAKKLRLDFYWAGGHSWFICWIKK
jgi:hypothetical protein